MFSGKSKQEIEQVLKKYSTKKSAVMDLLRIAQKERGHITKEDMEEISRVLGVNPIVVNSAATFYTMYEVDRPIGKHHIWVCRNISCSLLGADHIMKYLEKKLGIKMGETTADNRFTLDTAECLGSCGTAPMMQVDDDYHENLTEETIDRILEGLD
ncbi:MAG: NADH-quinone oxidoreductase subunit NuoE [Thermodesulfobacteriota bacterium]